MSVSPRKNLSHLCEFRLVFNSSLSLLSFSTIVRSLTHSLSQWYLGFTSQAACPGCGVTVTSQVPTLEITAEPSNSTSPLKTRENEICGAELPTGLDEKQVPVVCCCTARGPRARQPPWPSAAFSVLSVSLSRNPAECSEKRPLPSP